MAVKLRMTRIGRRHRPFFRINAVESHTPRDGKILEKLGHYDPIEKDPAKQIVLDRERTEYWLDKGAIPSDTVSQILLRKGIKHKYAEQKTARRAKAKAIAGAKGKLFNKAQRIAAKKEAEAAAEKIKTEAEEKAQAETESKTKEAEVKAKAEAAAEKAKTEAQAEEKIKPEPEAKPDTETAQEKVEAQAEAVEGKAEPEAAEEGTETKTEEAAKAKADEEKAESEAEKTES